MCAEKVEHCPPCRPKIQFSSDTDNVSLTQGNHLRAYLEIVIRISDT